MTLSHHLQVGAVAELLRGGGQDGIQGCTWVSLIRTTLQGDLNTRRLVEPKGTKTPSRT